MGVSAPWGGIPVRGMGQLVHGMREWFSFACRVAIGVNKQRKPIKAENGTAKTRIIAYFIAMRRYPVGVYRPKFFLQLEEEEKVSSCVVIVVDWRQIAPSGYRIAIISYYSLHSTSRCKEMHLDFPFISLSCTLHQIHA
jgi:hypothetical protein